MRWAYVLVIALLVAAGTAAAQTGDEEERRGPPPREPVDREECRSSVESEPDYSDRLTELMLVLCDAAAGPDDGAVLNASLAVCRQVVDEELPASRVRSRNEAAKEYCEQAVMFARSGPPAGPPPGEGGPPEGGPPEGGPPEGGPPEGGPPEGGPPQGGPPDENSGGPPGGDPIAPGVPPGGDGPPDE